MRAKEQWSMSTNWLQAQTHSKTLETDLRAKTEVGPLGIHRGRVWVKERKSEWRGEGEGRGEGGGEDRGNTTDSASIQCVCEHWLKSNYRLAWCVESRVYHNTAQMMTAYSTHTHTKQLMYKAFKQLLCIPIPKNCTYICARCPQPPSGTGCLQLERKHKPTYKCKCTFSGKKISFTTLCIARSQFSVCIYFWWQWPHLLFQTHQHYPGGALSPSSGKTCDYTFIYLSLSLSHPAGHRWQIMIDKSSDCQIMQWLNTAVFLTFGQGHRFTVNSLDIFHTALRKKQALKKDTGWNNKGGTHLDSRPSWKNNYADTTSQIDR